MIPINRAVTHASLRYARVGALGLFRAEREFARILAERQMRSGNLRNYVASRPARMTKIKLSRDAYGVITMRMEFEPVEVHRYRTVDLCKDCPRRWHEHTGPERRGRKP